MNAFQVISIALLSVLAANAQVIAPGRCPKPAVQKDFDTTRVNITQYVVFFLSLFMKSSHHLQLCGSCLYLTQNIK